MYEVVQIPKNNEKIHRHADLKKHVFTAGDGGQLHHLHPIATLVPSMVVKKGNIPDHLVMSARGKYLSQNKNLTSQKSSKNVY